MTVWILVEDQRPPVETPVLIVYKGNIRISTLCWDHPTYEESWKSYMYWDDPEDDIGPWMFSKVTHWTHLPELPTSLVV